jgi:hypothetical protein
VRLSVARLVSSSCELALAREVLERYRYLRRDMHCVFDTGLGLRLAFAGELPVLIDREVAVRVVHRATADPSA